MNNEELIEYLYTVIKSTVKVKRTEEFGASVESKTIKEYVAISRNLVKVVEFEATLPSLEEIKQIVKNKLNTKYMTTIAQSIKEQLTLSSSFIEFDEKEHIYTVNGFNPPSVSALLKKFIPVFPAEFIAGRVARSRNKPSTKFVLPEHTEDTVMAEWDAKRDLAANYGSYIHYRMECFLAEYTGVKPKELTIDFSMFTPQEYKDAEEAIKRGKEWIREFIESGGEIIATEVMLYHKVKKYVGTIDLVLFKDGKIILADWKSNRKCMESDHYGKKLSQPVGELLMNTTLNKYKLQLNLYKGLFEFNLSGGQEYEMVIVHLLPDSLKTYKVPDYTDLILKYI